MRSIVLQTLGGPDQLAVVERPVPEPGAGQVLVRMRAASLNYRDTLILRGGYGSRQKTADLVPLSDGAGEVVRVGPGVSRVKAGDRVTASFFQSWIAGDPNEALLDDDLGRAHDGVLSDYRVFPECGLVATPASLTDPEAAAFPCAGLTAWSAVVTVGRAKPGDIVLVQGTGGVSLFALQFAKLCGARVIATSSSSEKLARLRGMGADHVINYREQPDWGKVALDLTNGRGVDHVVEVAGTYRQTLRAIRPGGLVTVIGVLAGARAEILLPLVGSRAIRLQGVAVGPREGLEAMFRAVEAHRIKPVIDRVFDLDHAAEAYRHLAAGRHFGKVCIAL
ncbi:MAG: NAD(P)-dependent alcohol dehydrogenase [Alphaproteobacteria bacterium]|nr:NAD(P)-dependent alcohol dehydrogenase [Alphaproteobacteria bacterium]